MQLFEVKDKETDPSSKLEMASNCVLFYMNFSLIYIKLDLLNINVTRVWHNTKFA